MCLRDIVGDTWSLLRSRGDRNLYSLPFGICLEVL